ncbi:MAG: hypothetical protein EHM48_00790 [Planctomycetaceae bacterium]|nr:MAG: hypothetical protein EHM48_00790 [Planctomycetaceae bacterium]
MTTLIDWKILYLVALAPAIAGEHWMFARKWRRYERARWTMGVATVFVLAAPLGIIGLLDSVTLLWLLAGFGVAGAVTVGLYTDEAANVNEQARREIARETERQGTSVL